ncbi:hypothetical protein CJ030_MR4G020434 [Morella rubra]|uniref:Uncharacterized protein n=1 Tax=Morella rubra TaxID=262757 RepID=A0A6A1VUL3_9ROSI|nr:hypothetical protein CJ030_MR4G020434 [Morella rubra]
MATTSGGAPPPLPVLGGERKRKGQGVEGAPPPMEVQARRPVDGGRRQDQGDPIFQLVCCQERFRRIDWGDRVRITFGGELALLRRLDPGSLTETPDVFTDTHKDLVKTVAIGLARPLNPALSWLHSSPLWAFATSATVLGGVRQDVALRFWKSIPRLTLCNRIVNCTFAAFVTALVMFLSILTSRHQEKDYGKALPNKALDRFNVAICFHRLDAGFFCTGHFFVVKDRLNMWRFQCMN